MISKSWLYTLGISLGAEQIDDEIHFRMLDNRNTRTYADGEYLYQVQLENGSILTGLTGCGLHRSSQNIEVRGKLSDSNLSVTHKISIVKDELEEILSLRNDGKEEVCLAQFRFGFRLPFSPEEEKSRLIAVPFRINADGITHDYTVADLLAGKYANSNGGTDPSVEHPPLADADELRSEGWIWGNEDSGLLWIKYNPEHIEFSLCGVEKDALRFGGAGLALYNEPGLAMTLKSGETFAFGTTHYQAFTGDWKEGYAHFKAFLRQKGHGFPRNYTPPLNWNELFDVGWYHSDPTLLREHYTRDALMKEAAKAKEIGCDLLYLDPGWEVCEGTTLWDSSRLGPVSDFIHEVKRRYGLEVGYRTIGRVYRNEFPNAWYMRRKGETGTYHRPRINQQPAVEPVPLHDSEGHRNLALLPDAKANASSVISGYPLLHSIPHLNDGWYDNPASWISGGDPSWAEIDLGAVYQVGSVALGSEHTTHYGDRAITQMRILTASEYNQSSDASTWKEVFHYNGAPLHNTTLFQFPPVNARWVRVSILKAEGGAARIDELEIYEAGPASNDEQPVRKPKPVDPDSGDPIVFWEVCTQCEAWRNEKLKRILAITEAGMDFMMFDEFDWRGPCYDPNHGHEVPSTPEGHVKAVYWLVEETRKHRHQLLVEAHDPVWPWGVRYCPVYYRQGFSNHHYQENWGFEFMWDPIADLQSGKALCLFYYNLGTDIPLYDHITMEYDNDQCLSFWWYASTVRHLGIGGKKGLNSTQDNIPRWNAYKKAVARYLENREFFTRGAFVGLDEMNHVHLHPEEHQAAIVSFNLTVNPVHRKIPLSPKDWGFPENEQLHTDTGLIQRDGEDWTLAMDIPPMSPMVAIVSCNG